MSWYGEWRPYVPVARRRAQAHSYAKNLAKREGHELSPVRIEGRKIAHTFWGQSWCENLEHYSDFANRLPRGMTYVRNGSVIDLQISRGRVEAIVSGSEIYKVKIEIKTLARDSWKRIKTDCSASVASLLDLLQGRFDQSVMQRLTQPKDGLFPRPAEIAMKCSCPDWAGMCKHIAATMYGVGSRLDTQPDLLFTLRDVDHLELIHAAVSAENLDQALTGESTNPLGNDDLGALFGIELQSGESGVRKITRKTQVVPRKSKGTKGVAKATVKTVLSTSTKPRKTTRATSSTGKAGVATIRKSAKTATARRKSKLTAAR